MKTKNKPTIERAVATEKVVLNGVEYAIQLQPLTPQTENTTTTLNPAVTTSEVVREAPAVTDLPRWEDGAH
ncbi:MAG: hypothetical protein SNJ72_05285 [Fimbriimonadales bacterium]